MKELGTIRRSAKSHRAKSSHPDRRNFIPQTSQLVSLPDAPRRFPLSPNHWPQLQGTAPTSPTPLPVCPTTIPNFPAACPIVKTIFPNFWMTVPNFPTIFPQFFRRSPHFPGCPSRSPIFPPRHHIFNGLFQAIFRGFVLPREGRERADFGCGEAQWRHRFSAPPVQSGVALASIASNRALPFNSTTRN